MIGFALGLAPAPVPHGHHQALAAHRLALLAMQDMTGCYDLLLAHHTPSRPCRYCGRTSQAHQHDNCDGCGAPKENR